MLLCQIIVTREFKHYNISKHNLKLRSRIYRLRKKEKHAKYLLDVIIAKLIQSYFVILINLLVVYCDGRVLNLQNVCPILMVYIGTMLRHARKMIALPKYKENICFHYKPSYLLRSWISATKLTIVFMHSNSFWCQSNLGKATSSYTMLFGTS